MQFSDIIEQHTARWGTPAGTVRSPARINVIGEHTDYNDGFVLPAAVDREIYLAVSNAPDRHFHFVAADLNDEFKADSLPQVPQEKQRWVNYILGVIDQLQKDNKDIPPFRLIFGGTIPIGAGMSSSAALECGVLTALNYMLDLNLSNREVALTGQRAENQFVGVNCGIMDQYANMFGREAHVLQLDCRHLTHRYFPLSMDRHVLVLCDTHVKHSLAGSEYNTRRRECEQGVEAVRQIYPQVKALRDVDLRMLHDAASNMSETVFKRCLYVIEENQRVQNLCQALENDKLKEAGKLMYESHAGLQKQYQVSCEELDALVHFTRDRTYVWGARMMGGGFGGCTINLIERESVSIFEEEAASFYQDKFGKQPSFYAVNIVNGTEWVK